MDYKELYFALFGVLADAVEAIETGEFTEAKKMLIEAMQQAEERYIQNVD